MKNLFFFIFIALLLGSCSSKSTCNKILDAAKEGKLFLTIGQNQSIKPDYLDYFSNDPSKFVSEAKSNNIFIPQFFDSYKLLSTNATSIDTLHTSLDLKIFGKPGETNYEQMKKYVFDIDSKAWIENEVIYYVDGLVKTQHLEYFITKGDTRFKQHFYCVKKDKKWLIYKAVFEVV